MVKTIFDPAVVGSKDAYRLLIGLVVPRPIGWIGTVGSDGVRNLAPFSFFNVFGPVHVGFSTVRPDGAHKDTLKNVLETGVFTVNTVTEDVAEAMNLSSGSYPAGVDEFEVAGLTARTGDLVSAPMVVESQANLECRLIQTVDLGSGAMASTLVIGETLRFHVDPELFVDGRIDPGRYRAVGRLGGRAYSTTRDRFEMPRPQQDHS